MKTRYTLSLVLLSLLCLACSQHDKPSQEDLSAFIVDRYSMVPAVPRSIEILETQNVGDKVEPVVKSRIKSQWEFDSDLYAPISDGDIIVYDESDVWRVKGAIAEIFMIAISTREADEWQHKIKVESIKVKRSKLLTGEDEKQILEMLETRERPAGRVKQEDMPESAVMAGGVEHKKMVDRWYHESKQRDFQKAAEVEKKFASNDLAWVMSKGKDVYSINCAACHEANGQGIPGIFPAIAGSTIVTGAVSDHIDIVLNGKAGTAMQAYGEQLNAVDLAAVITYERNGFGNNTGDMVKPGDIAAAK